MACVPRPVPGKGRPQGPFSALPGAAGSGHNPNPSHDPNRGGGASPLPPAPIALAARGKTRQLRPTKDRCPPVITLLHTADLHLDSPLKSLALRDEALQRTVATATRTALARMVDLAIEEGVSALLIAGDLFDGEARSAKTAAFVTAQCDRLAAAGIRVFLIKGNHDAENPITGDLVLPDNVHVFDGRGGKVQLAEDLWIHGVSFSGRHAPDSLLPKFPAPVPGAVNIALLHTSLSGAAGHDPYAPCTVPQLQAAGFDYWALGHVHKRTVHSESPWIVMPGMPQGRDMGETGAKSVTLLQIDAGRITTAEHPLSVVDFERIAVDVTGLEDATDLRAALRTRLATVADGLRADQAILRVTLTGKTPLRWPLLRDRETWAEALTDMAAETGRLWIDRLEFELTEPASTGSATAAGELAALMQEILAEEGFLAAARAEVDEVLAQLPPSERRALLPSEEAAPALAERLVREGAEIVTARLKTGGA